MLLSGLQKYPQTVPRALEAKDCCLVRYGDIPRLQEQRRLPPDELAKAEGPI